MTNHNALIEIELDDRVIYLREKCIIYAQALWRGALTRKRLRDIRDVYSELFHELEDDSSVHVYWGTDTQPCNPQFYKTYDYKKLMEKRDEENAKRAASRDQSNLLPTSSDVLKTSSGHATCDASQNSDTQNLKAKATNLNSVPERAHTQVLDDLVPERDIVTREQNTNVLPLDKPFEIKSSICDMPEKQTSQIKIGDCSSPNHAEKGHNQLENENTDNSVNDSKGRESNEERLPYSPEINVKLSQEIGPGSQEKTETEFHDLTNVSGVYDLKDADSDLRGLSEEELTAARRTVAMELLWIQQAIDSRKQYLQLKSQVTG